MNKVRAIGLVSLFQLVFLLVPIRFQQAEALSCRQIADQNEEYRIAVLRNPNFGLRTKSSIAFTVKVYKNSFGNQECISKARLVEIVEVTKAIQFACKIVKPNSSDYKVWKDRREFWARMYGSNFNYACSLWNEIKVES